MLKATTEDKDVACCACYMLLLHVDIREQLFVVFGSDAAQPIDEITTVSDRIEGVDPLLERIESLNIVTPLLNSLPPSETSITDILVRKPSSSSSIQGNLNPKVLLELFSMYREWQEGKVKNICGKQMLSSGNHDMLQEEIDSKIETADALAIKLLQRFNYSVSAMRSTAHSLAEVQHLQVEVGELKGRLTEVISNCDALCKRIAAEGPHSLRSSGNSTFPANDLESFHMAFPDVKGKVICINKRCSGSPTLKRWTWVSFHSDPMPTCDRRCSTQQQLHFAFS
ncbi:hypothetical protein MUK42_02825 [Musa troglodytarum]|nr:hypothetical protein MUK42_02825 [Musa troglodytarum]